MLYYYLRGPGWAPAGAVAAAAVTEAVMGISPAGAVIAFAEICWNLGLVCAHRVVVASAKMAAVALMRASNHHFQLLNRGHHSEAYGSNRVPQCDGKKDWNTRVTQ